MARQVSRNAPASSRQPSLSKSTSTSRPEALGKYPRQTADPLDQIPTDASESLHPSSEEIVDAGNPALDSRFLTDTSNPLIAAGRRVTRPSGFPALEPPRIYIVSPVEKRTKEPDLGVGRGVLMDETRVEKHGNRFLEYTRLSVGRTLLCDDGWTLEPHLPHSPGILQANLNQVEQR